MGEQGSWTLSRIKRKSGQVVGSVLLDSGATVDAALSELAYVTFLYKGKPIPTQEEYDRFELIDDEIQKLCTEQGASCVAIWTAKGVRDWIVYCANGKIFRSAAQISLGRFKPRIKLQGDRTWAQYFDLKSMVDGSA